MMRFFLLLAFLSAAPLAKAQPLAPSTDWTMAMAEFAAWDAASPSPDGCVLFVGSSSIRMWSTLAEDFPGVPVVNRGFGGSQVVDLLVHFDRVVTPHRPRWVVVYSGSNDLASGKSASDVVRDIDAFCGRVLAAYPEARVAFICLQHAPARWHLREKMEEVNAAVRLQAGKESRLHVIDTNPFMLGADGMPRLELYRPDHLHMSSAGYVVWRDLVAPVVTP